VEPNLVDAVRIIAIAAPIVALLLGYLSEKSFFPAIVVGGATAVACLLCILGAELGAKLGGEHWAWAGLLVAILLVTFLAQRLGKGLGKERGAIFVPGLWLGFCGSCAFGYWVAGGLGLLTITAPSILIFWAGMAAISRHLLPLRERGQWVKAFRSLFSFSLGTNYPYQVLEDRELATRVPGNPYGQFFAGPGIVLTGPAHAPIIWEGLQFKRIGEPGLNFTARYETLYQTVDLRPQLRSFYVEAITKDGIRIRVLTFIPFKLHAKGQEPQLKSSFPLDKDSVYRAMWAQPVEKGNKIPWDELPRVMAERLLRKIIGTYQYDELCVPRDPDDDQPIPKKPDPRIAIRKDLLEQLQKELEPYGIEVIGGGISNLMPMDSSVIDKRIEAWRAEWERKIKVILGKGKAAATLIVELAYARAQAELIQMLSNAVRERPGIDSDLMTKVAALRFIEALEEMASTPQVQHSLPDGAVETISYVRQALTRDSMLK
jgi:regulator of protease activity HflC (stomatin/prohibitin superfamily)